MSDWEESGEVIDAEVTLSIQDEMPSGPEAVLDGSWEIRQRMPFSVQRSSSRQGKGGEEGGMGERGGAEVLKQEELRHWALSRSDSMASQAPLSLCPITNTRTSWSVYLPPLHKHPSLSMSLHKHTHIMVYIPSQTPHSLYVLSRSHSTLRTGLMPSKYYTTVFRLLNEDHLSLEEGVVQCDLCGC